MALPRAIIPLLDPFISVIDTRTDMYWAALGLRILIGSPIAGELLQTQSSETSWRNLQVLADLCMVVSTTLSVFPTIHVARRERVRRNEK